MQNDPKDKKLSDNEFVQDENIEKIWHEDYNEDDDEGEYDDDNKEYLKMKDEVKYYLESHITIEPVFDERRVEAQNLANQFKFKLAHLLMKKEREATEKRSDRDAFMTGHSKSKSDIIERTKNLVESLKQNGFKVWRYKIEDTLIDSKINDEWKII